MCIQSLFSEFDGGTSFGEGIAVDVAVLLQGMLRCESLHTIVTASFQRIRLAYDLRMLATTERVCPLHTQY